MNPAALVAHVTFDPDGNRIPLPKHLCDRLPWLSGSEPRSAWLWMISPGRYRLLSEEQVKTDPHLESLRDFMFQQQLVPTADPSMSKGPNETSIVARLHPTELKVNKSYWRLSFPAVLDEFIPLNCDQKKFSILLCLDGYLEIWYTEILRAAVFQHCAS
jgi:hypothetical protein